MSAQTVLVIDDSATIRKMVDSHLTQEGYRVVLAPTAEKGLELAPQLVPDLILLDHQLPGTTGIEVCKKIIQMPECLNVPFVVSSTLRKQAYIEYMDVPNVVDSLPKPFKPELLKTTVANALEVGAMIVSSQTSGTAVPEVVDGLDDTSLSGVFGWVGLREVFDFLNNGNKSGMLEVELERHRVLFFIQNGRFQSVVSASVTAEDVAETLPESLQNLAPLLRFTMSSGASSQLDGLVELLDRKVIDPRMLKTLLRFQASYLTRLCFNGEAKAFSFYPEREMPAISRRAPLEISLSALLVEAMLHCDASELPTYEYNIGWLRRALRGQNLDRSGLSAKHVQVLAQLDTEPVTTAEIATRADLPLEEAERVLEGLRMAEWIDAQPLAEGSEMIVLESNPEGSLIFRELIADTENRWSGKVVRDEFGLQLLLKRSTPDVIVIELTGEEELKWPTCLGSESDVSQLDNLCLILPDERSVSDIPEAIRHSQVISRPFSKQNVLTALEELQLRHGAKSSQSDQRHSSNSELSTAGKI
ncbi:Transcriptional regulatory protein AfsQ1 [Thalassoglobus neptunius]|uniref:Transcriptional regulatory protein AfsQ1 n=1 Tax=Thalassoglobus neptunius TaxID=1938619 RepID=A0A5C5X7P1_9PLAN|nr:response regulator [Thalassoglobus neptunius]TWT58125.1 Transcriptional regulatory protein AfsQ1 [Thalassoglobus neptunius]